MMIRLGDSSQAPLSFPFTTTPAASSTDYTTLSTAAGDYQLINGVLFDPNGNIVTPGAGAAQALGIPTGAAAATPAAAGLQLNGKVLGFILAGMLVFAFLGRR